MDSKTLYQLVSRTFITLTNSFPGMFFATLDGLVWRLKVEHCTYRDFSFEYEGQNLDLLVQKALTRIENFEQDIENKTKALETLYPEKNKYEITDILRSQL